MEQSIYTYLSYLSPSRGLISLSSALCSTMMSSLTFALASEPRNITSIYLAGFSGVVFLNNHEKLDQV